MSGKDMHFQVRLKIRQNKSMKTHFNARHQTRPTHAPSAQT